MASNAVIQQYVNSSADPGLAIYANNTQEIPINVGKTSVYVTNVTEYVVNHITGPGIPAGNTSEVQFNSNGSMRGDDGLTYNPTTDSLTVIGNLTAGTVLTNNLKYANGSPWTFDAGSYSNANVTAYLPTYTGNLSVTKVTASLFAGDGANISNIAGANIVGTVSSATSATTATSATSATTAGTVTTNAQPNITSVGTLTSVNVTGNITGGNASLGNLVSANYFSGSGANITGLNASNIATGTISSSVLGNSTIYVGTTALTLNRSSGSQSLTGVSIDGSASSATTAGTVTTNAQPNITSVGTLNGVTSTATVDFTGASNVALGPVGNVHISGGSSGQILTTNGSGVLSWSSPSYGNLDQVTTNNNETTHSVYISNTTVSTNYNNGALKVAGGTGIGGNLHVNAHIAAAQQVYAGHLSDFGSWNNPLFVGRSAGSDYVQSGMVNTNDTGSADWIAYGDLSSTDSGWADLGFTGTGFNDPLYTITKASDGYVFVQGLQASDGGPQGGNLVVATGGEGTDNDIVFATGGFLASDEAMRLDYSDSTLYVGGHAYGVTIDNPTPRVTHLNVNGNITTAGNISATNISLSGTGTCINAGSGNILTNKVTGTMFKFLHGSYSTTLQGNVSATTDLTVTLPSTAGTNGQVLKTDGSGNLDWADNRDEPKFSLKYATFSVEVGKRYMVDTVTQQAITTLPASPSTGDAIFFVDAYGTFNTNNFVIHPNGKTVMGASGDYTVSTANLSFGLVYNGAGDWRVY